MRRTPSIVSGLTLGVLTTLCSPLLAVFSSVSKVQNTASVTITGNPPIVFFTIQATPLPASAFFGKNVVIPVQLIGSGPLDPHSVNVSIIYQMFNQSVALTPISPPIPITFVATPGNPTILNGSAIIPESDLQAIQNGGQLYYVFRTGNVIQGVGAPSSVPSTFTSLFSTSSFQTTIIDQICLNVTPSGSVISVPDLFVNDGETSVSLAPGAIASPGTLCIMRDDTSGWPSGPGGAKPAVVYTITLKDTSLLQTVGLTLSYPADVNGNVLGLNNANPLDLGMYWLGPEDSSGNPVPNATWQVLSQASIDTTRHTVAGVSGHFSTFGLFAAGATTAADLRPAQRIITPNGDGKNDAAVFGSGIDSVKIFDVRGRRVKTIAGPSPIWDGTDDSGKTVESGVYLYQFTSNGSRVSGVIGVAK